MKVPTMTDMNSIVDSVSEQLVLLQDAAVKVGGGGGGGHSSTKRKRCDGSRHVQLLQQVANQARSARFVSVALEYRQATLGRQCSSVF